MHLLLFHQSNVPLVCPKNMGKEDKGKQNIIASAVIILYSRSAVWVKKKKIKLGRSNIVDSLWIISARLYLPPTFFHHFHYVPLYGLEVYMPRFSFFLLLPSTIISNAFISPSHIIFTPTHILVTAVFISSAALWIFCWGLVSVEASPNRQLGDYSHLR